MFFDFLNDNNCKSYNLKRMAVPKKKTSKSKSKMRISHLKKKLATIKYVEDKKSGELRRPHHIDKTTGEYRGKKIINPAR